jgi:hypothetical protein
MRASASADQASCGATAAPYVTERVGEISGRSPVGSYAHESSGPMKSPRSA